MTTREKSKRQLPFIVDLGITIVLSVALALVIKFFVVEVFYVPSGSMLNTIQIGDQLLGDKITLNWEQPHKEQIVTFVSPEDGKTILVKRIVAEAGQTVDLRNGVLYVDDVAQTPDYIEGKPTLPITAPGAVGLSYPYTVPQGYVFMMGDNRTNSFDSRYFGPVPVSSITSKIMLKFWPLTEFRVL